MLRIIGIGRNELLTSQKAYRRISSRSYYDLSAGATSLALRDQSKRGLHAFSSNSSSSLHLRRRHYSTDGPSPSPIRSTEKSDARSIPPSTSSIPKPRKVELHPAPVKPSSTTPTINASSPPPPPSALNATSSSPSSSTHSSPSSSEASREVQPTPQSQAEGIMAQAKEDLKTSEALGLLKPPPPNASTFQRLFHQAKELFKFYVRGLKMQWTNYKTVGEIKKRIKEEESRGDLRGMTRAETQFIRTHKKDLAKLVPFVLVLIILEEALPLIVIYAPFMLPSTTILPTQAERIYNKQEDKRIETLTAAKWYLQNERLDRNALSALGVKGLSNDIAWTFSRALGISDRGPRSMVNNRIAKHLKYIAEDDSLLSREGSGSGLSVVELRNALGERGFMTRGLSQEQLLDQLQRWLSSTKDESAMIGQFLSYSLTVDVSRTAKP